MSLILYFRYLESGADAKEWGLDSANAGNAQDSRGVQASKETSTCFSWSKLVSHHVVDGDVWTQMDRAVHTSNAFSNSTNQRRCEGWDSDRTLRR